MSVYFESVSYGFQRKQTFIEGVSAHFEKGCFSCLIGPNGSGKSTLMRLAAGLIKASEGTITIDGTPINALSQRQLSQALAFVPQKSTPAFDMTVLSYVLTGRTPFLSALAQESARDVDIAQKALADTQISFLRDRDLLTLSGGEMQRAMIAKALCQTTDILLLDEPCASLDIAHAVNMMLLLQNLAHQKKMCVICVMHDLNLACHFADTLHVMKNGQLILAGGAKEVIQNPRLSEVYDIPLQVIQNDGEMFLWPKTPNSWEMS